MAWRILKQPNGLFARFSDVVDAFTDFDMSEEQVLRYCTKEAGEQTARTKLLAAKNNPERWDEAISSAVSHSIWRVLEDCVAEDFCSCNEGDVDGAFEMAKEVLYRNLVKVVLTSIPKIEIKEN